MAYADDIAALERRRQLAQALMMQGAQAQAPVQSGRFAVGPSALSSLGRLGSIALGTYADRKFEGKQKEAGETERNRLAEVLRGMGGEAPMATPGINPNEPQPGTGEVQTPGGAPSAPMAPAAPPADPRRAAAAAALRGMTVEQMQGLINKQVERQFAPPEMKDVGDAIVALDANGREVYRVPKGQTPDSVASTATTKRGQDLTAATAKEGHSITKRGQDISASTAVRGQDVTMRGQDIGANTAAAARGTTERGQDLSYGIRAREQDQKAADAKAAVAKGASNREMMLNNTMAAVDDADKMANWRTTGMAGAITRKAPGGGAGTDALNLANTVKTIQANLSFDELQRMREASKTGGALGAITERELDLLGSTVANLDPNMDSKDLKKALAKVRKHLGTIKTNLAQIDAERPPSLDANGTGSGEIDSLMQEFGGMPPAGAQ